MTAMLVVAACTAAPGQGGGSRGAGASSPRGTVATSTPSPVSVPSATTTPSAPPTLGVSPSSPPASPAATRITSAEQAIAAVVAQDPRFLGYGPLDPNLIGQANHVRAKQTETGFELTFVSGSGDCPAGCINHDYVKFHVGRDGSVVKRCEWSEGEEPHGTPC